MKSIYLLIAGLSGLSFAAPIQSDPFSGTVIDGTKWQLPPFTDGNGVFSQDNGLYYHNNGSGTDQDEVNLTATGVASVASDWTVRFDAHVPDLAALTAPGQSVRLEMKIWNSADENDRADIQTSIIQAPAPYGKIRTLGADITNDYWQTDPVAGGSTGVFLDPSTQSQVTLAFSWSASTTTLSAWYAPAGGATDWIRLTSWNLGAGSPTEWSLGAGASFMFYIGGSSQSLNLVTGDNVRITDFVVSSTALSGRIPPTITTGDNPSKPDFTPLPQGAVGNPYSTTIQANDGALPHTWSLVIGSLPPGLTLEPATGTIHGTPTVAGTSDFRVRVTGNDGAYAEGSYGITVLPDPFIDSYRPPMTSHNNIREFDGTLDVVTDYTLAVAQNDPSHYTATFLIDGGGSQTIANLLRTGNRLQNTARPMPVTGSNLLDFIMLSDGVNSTYVHVAQETYDSDDVSFGVASWTTHVGNVAVADWAGSWDFDTYGDPDIRNDADGFDHDLFTLEIQQVDANHIQIMLPSGGALPLLVSGNTAYLESPPIIVGTIRYHEFRLQGDGQRLSVHSVASEIDNLTDVAVTIGLAEKTVSPPTYPAVTTGAPNWDASNSITLVGTVNPKGLATTAWFEYGTTTAYGGTISVNLSPNDGVEPIPVSARLSNLPANATYHYRLVAMNAAGTAVGDDHLFITERGSGDYQYTTADNTATITGYTGTGGAISIPSTINGLSVTGIGYAAFDSVTALTSMVIPQGVTNIGAYAFDSCTGLIEITIPNSVTSIGDYAFYSCSSLTGITIPDGVTTIARGLFNGCSNLANVTFPANLTSIGGRVFSGCDQLTTVTFPESLTSIDNMAFWLCDGLTTVNIPASVTSIGTSAFRQCSQLTSITVDPGNPNYSSVDGVLFDKLHTVLIQVPAGKGGMITIPDSVASIGYGAFWGCTGIAAITAGPGNANLSSVDGVLFNKSQTSLIVFPAAKSGTYRIPDGVTDVGEFYDCSGLTTVVFPASVSSLQGRGAFGGCSGLTSAVFLGDAPTFDNFFGFASESTSLTVYFFNGSSGFTTPTWMDHPAVNMGEPSQVPPWLLMNGLPHDTDLYQDLNGDGVSVLMAYALNLNPNLNLQSSMPAPVIGEDGTLGISFYAASEGITYIAETSNDLVSWHTAGVMISPPDTNGYRIATIRIDSSSGYLRLRVTTSTDPYVPPTPDGFSLIPAGDFLMGDQSDPLVGYSGELPVHSVFVSAFYMAKYEVTKELWDEVRTWGAANGYTDLAVGNGNYASKGAKHPVHSITWYDMVKWCNARSQKEGLTPCYTVGGATYKTGSSAPDCNWNADGYRLPTEAEWEKAARGGLSGKNFPWGDTIMHSQANYYSNSSYGYDVSLTRGYHPTYAVGGYPYSSPVGSFAPNGYGLFDMAGNMWECCWDWDGSYPSTSQIDPHGAASGTYRVARGSSWAGYADLCRVSNRDNSSPGSSFSFLGFRPARSSVP